MLVVAVHMGWLGVHVLHGTALALHVCQQREESRHGACLLLLLLLLLQQQVLLVQQPLL